MDAWHRAPNPRLEVFSPRTMPQQLLQFRLVVAGTPEEILSQAVHFQGQA